MLQSLGGAPAMGLFPHPARTQRVRRERTIGRRLKLHDGDGLY